MFIYKTFSSSNAAILPSYNSSLHSSLSNLMHSLSSTDSQQDVRAESHFLYYFHPCFHHKHIYITFMNNLLKLHMRS